jgi:hypothetical protein
VRIERAAQLVKLLSWELLVDLHPPEDDNLPRMNTIRRRDLFSVVTTAGVATVLGTACTTPASSPELAVRRDKRKAQYQPNSAEVQTFYRVNRYPAK